MKTSQFTSLTEQIKLSRNQYLYEGLTTADQKSMLLWETAGRKLAEAQLTADQISAIFQQVQTAKGNRTLVGKGVDAGSAVKKAYDDLVSKVQNSGPVKNVDALYDQAAEKLKQATGGDQGVMQYVQKYRDFAKKHPIAQSLIYSALIAAAGISGAGLGGAAALGLLKMTDKLLQGEKFSTAVGKGVATGALAYGASKLGDLIKNTLNPSTNTGTITWEATGEGMTSANFKNGKIVGDIIYHNQSLSPGDPGYNEAYKAIMDYASQNGMTGAAASNVQDFGKAGKIGMGPLAKGGDWMDYESAMEAVNPTMVERVQNVLNDPGVTDEYKTELMKKLLPFAKSVKRADAIDRVVDSVSRMADRAVDAGYQAVSDTSAFESHNLSTAQVLALFERVERINNKMLSEGRLFEAAKPKQQPVDQSTAQPATAQPVQGQSTAAPAQTPAQPKQGLMSKVGSALGKGLGAVAQGAAKVGRSMTAKVSSDALTKAWQAAGSPTDSVAIEKLLQAQGVNYEVINTVFQANKIPVTIKPTAAQGQTPAVFTPGGNRQGGGTTTATPAPAGATPSAQGQAPAMPTAAPAAGSTATPAGSPAPQATGTTSAAPQASAQPAPITAADIKKAIPNMKVGELRGIKKSIDYILDIQDRKKAAGKKPKATPTAKAKKQPTAQTSQDATKAALKARQAGGVGAYEDFKRAVTAAKKIL
jgi:hypothetical protein